MEFIDEEDDDNEEVREPKRWMREIQKNLWSKSYKS